MLIVLLLPLAYQKEVSGISPQIDDGDPATAMR